MWFDCRNEDLRPARLDNSGRPKTQAVAGRLNDVVDVKVEVADSYSLDSARMPANVETGKGWAVKVHHNPVDWNLLGIALGIALGTALGTALGIAGCAATEANPARVEVESCTYEHTHSEGQGRLGNVERDHRLDGQVEGDLWQAECSLYVVVQSL